MRYGNIELHNVRTVIEQAQGGGIQLSRVSQEVRAQLNNGAQQAALNGCGCEIRFNLLGESATVWLQRGAPELCDPIGVAEVWFGPFQASYEFNPRLIRPEPTAITITYPAQLERLERIAKERGLSFDPRLVRVILPYDIPTFLLGVEGTVGPPEPGQIPTRRYLAYGSSITHGGNAIAPAATYAMRIARHLGYDLLNLGFAGSAQLEPALADYMAEELDWDIATLELGINVLDTWSAAEFARRVAYFVPRIAQSHPHRWIFCTDMFTCAADLAEQPRIAAFRAAVRETVAALKLPGLIYIDGRTLLPDPVDLTSDLVHPAASGMEIIAQHLMRHIRATLNGRGIHAA